MGYLTTLLNLSVAIRMKAHEIDMYTVGIKTSSRLLQEGRTCGV